MGKLRAYVCLLTDVHTIFSDRVGIAVEKLTEKVEVHRWCRHGRERERKRERERGKEGEIRNRNIDRDPS